MAVKQKTNFNFEKSVEKLNQLVEQMEQGGLTLEESLKSFEEGISLIRNCQKALKEAEQKVKILTKKGGKDTLEDYSETE